MIYGINRFPGERFGDSPETEPGTGEKCDIIGRLAGR
jgi:hypothetical protein